MKQEKKIRWAILNLFLPGMAYGIYDDLSYASVKCHPSRQTHENGLGRLWFSEHLRGVALDYSSKLKACHTSTAKSAHI